MSDSSRLRTPKKLLRAFGLVAARHSSDLRVLAIRDAALSSGGVHLSRALIESEALAMAHYGKPDDVGVCIGGNTYELVGGVQTLVGSEQHNIGFVLLGTNDAATAYCTLGGEAGVNLHAYDLLPGIQYYDSPLVLWTFFVYLSLRDSQWLSELEVPGEHVLHFNPFTASVETLKAFLNKRATSMTTWKGIAKRTRGRKPDTDPKRDEKIAEAWQTGRYKTYEALGKEIGTTERDVRLALDRHRKRNPPRKKGTSK